MFPAFVLFLLEKTDLVMMSCFQLEVHTLLHNVHLTAKWRQKPGNINVTEQKQASTRYSQEQSIYDMFFYVSYVFFGVPDAHELNKFRKTMVREKMASTIISHVCI